MPKTYNTLKIEIVSASSTVTLRHNNDMGSGHNVDYQIGLRMDDLF